MTNQWEEFRAYVLPPVYTSSCKQDASYLGRMSFETIKTCEGLSRILTILARGYLFHEKDGKLRKGNPYDETEYARNALRAWCSVPEKSSDAEHPTDFRQLSAVFPELVNQRGEGWFFRHVKNVISFVRKNPDTTGKRARAAVDTIAPAYKKNWQKRVRQFQVPIFAVNTKGAWVLRFDDVIADALEEGPLRTEEYPLPEVVAEKLRQTDLGDVPFEVASDVVCYILANKKEDTEWVVLPVSGFDFYYGKTYFSRKWLAMLSGVIIERSQQNRGICRARLLDSINPAAI